MESVSKQSGHLGAEFSLRDRKLGQIQVCQRRGWLAKGTVVKTLSIALKVPFVLLIVLFYSLVKMLFFYHYVQLIKSSLPLVNGPLTVRRFVLPAQSLPRANQ